MSFVLGLTGSIGMGKSTTAAMFRARGVPVYDADAVVHALYRGEAAPLIEAAFPGTVNERVVDRTQLGQAVLGSPNAMKQLEHIVHPLVRQAENQFRLIAAHSLAPLIVLDVPLLFETGAERRCDAVLVVTAGPDIQRRRVFSRPGMTAGKFAAVLARQIPDAQKRSRAHFVVDTSHGMESAKRDVEAILRALAGRSNGRNTQYHQG